MLEADASGRPAVRELKPGTPGPTVTLHAPPWEFTLPVPTWNLGVRPPLSPHRHLPGCMQQHTGPYTALSFTRLVSVVFYENSGLVGFCARSWVRATMDLRMSIFSFGFVYFVH